MLTLTTRHRRWAVRAGGAAGAVLATMALAAAPAGAQTTNPANSTLIGSGSSTTYNMMQSLDTLFSDAQGCQIFDQTGAHQPLDFSCASQAPGFVTPESLAAGNGENPYNDVAVEMPAIGSSNGINQLKYQGANTPSNGFLPAPINFARSSRALKTSDVAGQNFVAYAKDGVDWVTFSKVNNLTTGLPTECGGAAAPDIEQSFLQQIWNGTISNWAQLCADIAEFPNTPTNAQYRAYASSDAPICVYTAQDGSGTLATWDSYTGITTESVIGTLTPNKTASSWASAHGLSSAFVNAGCRSGSNSTAYGQTHQIFENETKQIVAQGSLQKAHPYSDTKDAIFFYSFGRFSLDCKTNNAICDPTGFTLKNGKIGNQTPNRKNIIASDCGAAGSGCFTGVPWAVPRYLYNVYGNGDTSANVVPATPATVNYVSEVGFLCKPQTEFGPVTVSGKTSNQTYSIVDPNTGRTYVSEVRKTITATGFFPLPLQQTENQGTINFPAVSLLPAIGSAGDAYGVFDPHYDATITPSANSAANRAQTNPSGYCKVFTTSH